MGTIRKKGFTLVELLIVVAIIGILATIALPAYQNYTAKANFGAALAEMAAFRERVVESLATNGVCPSENDTAWTASKVLAGYSLKAGEGTSCLIIVKFAPAGVSAKVVDKVVQLSGDMAGGDMFSWTCTTDAPAEVLPVSCTHVEAAPEFP